MPTRNSKDDVDRLRFLQRQAAVNGMSPCRKTHIMQKINKYEREIELAKRGNISAEEQLKRVMFFQGLINQCKAMLKEESVD